MEGDVDEMLHEKIANGEEENVVKELVLEWRSKNKFDKYIMNSENTSAVLTALNHKQIKMYDILLGLELRLSPWEDWDMIIESMPDEMMKDELRHVHQKYAQNPNDRNYLDKLIKHSRTGHDDIVQEERKKIRYRKCISQAFEELNETKSIVPILKYVSLSKLIVVFDLNRDSAEVMVPTARDYTQGITFHREGNIYISAKDLWDDAKISKPCGVLAHELCHYAMQLLYNNECKPYTDSDNDRKIKFEEVARHCQSYKHLEELIEVVFEHKHYVEKVRHAELIVRVPHILAHYRSDPDKLEDMKASFAPLFEYYYETTLVDLENAYPRLESKVKIEKLNEKIGLLKKLKSNEEDMFRPRNRPSDKPSHSNYLPDNESKVVIKSLIKSNYPQLTVKEIDRQLNRRPEPCHIAVEFAKLLEDVELRDRIEDALDSCMQPWLIIDCSNESSADVLNKSDVLQKAKSQKIVFVRQNDGSDGGTVIFHKWDDLSEATQKRLFEKTITFQGKDLKLKKVLPLKSDALEDIPLEKLMEGKLVVGENIVETIDNDSTIVRSFTVSNQTRHLNFSDIIKQAELTKVIVLSNEPGMGKSTEWKLMARRIKDCNPGNWVSFIDLKQLIESFEGNDEKAFENKKEIANYFCSTILKIKGFDAHVFLQLFEDDRVVFLMDALDEISPTYKDSTLKLMKAVIEKSRNQIWISTRPHLKNELKGQVGQGDVYELRPFTKSDRDRFLQKRLEIKGFQGEDLKEAMRKIQSLYRIGIEAWAIIYLILCI